MTKAAFFRVTAILTGLVFLQACASKPPAVPDTTPLVKSSIVTSNIKNNGFKGQFANDTVQVRKTVANMQRIDSDSKFTGSILGRIGGKQSRSEIIRLDKNLEWHLDNKTKRYRECQIGKCLQLSSLKADAFSGETAEEIEQEQAIDECPLTLSQNEFSIKRTGETRELNGFPATEYKVDWKLGATDSAGKTALSVITIDVWTTPETGALAEAIAMQSEFDRALQQRLEGDLPAVFLKAAPAASLDFVLQYLLDGIGERDKQKIEALMAKATEIKGFPISQKFQWDSKNETCAAPPEPEAEKKNTLDTGSLSGLLSSVGKQLVNQEVEKKKEEKRREIALQPILSVIEEIKSIEIIEIRESQMSVPSNYKLENRS